MLERLGSRNISLGLLLLLMAAGLAVRVHYARPDAFPSVDGVFYLQQSRDLVLENRLPFNSFPPGWPVLASLPLYFSDASDPARVFRVAQGANVFLGVMWAGLAFLLLRRELGPWLALLGAAVLLALPLAIISAKGDLSEMSYSCVLLVALLLWPRDRFQTGLALGCAYLIRPEALLIAVGGMAWGVWRERRVPWGLILGTSLCVIPYVLFIHHHTGHWALSGKMGFLAAVRESHQGSALLGLVAGNLKTFLIHLPRMVGVPIVLLAVLGAVARPRYIYLSLLALAPLPLFDFAMAERYWLPYLPVILLAAGIGGQVLRDMAKSLPHRVVSGVLLSACLVGVVVVSGDSAFWVSRNPNAYPGLRDAGQWLAPRITPDTKIAGYKPFTSYWAGGRFVKYPPNLGVEAILDELQAQDVEYLVVNFHVARLLAPELKPLLQQPLAPELVGRVQVLEVFDYTPDDHTTVVFALASESGR